MIKSFIKTLIILFLVVPTAIAQKIPSPSEFFGFNIGLELGQITVVLLVMTLLYLLSKFLKFQQKYWIIGISTIAIILSGQMILERI